MGWRAMMATPLRVLIVEDHPEDADLVAYELRHYGFLPTVQLAQSEQEFSSLLNTTPDVVICDYHLPGFGGRRALQLCRARSADLPFIVVSGDLKDEQASEMLRFGANDFVHKDR